MAKISYRRLATAMVELLDSHTVSEVAASAAEIMTAGGGRPHLERLIPELEREMASRNGHMVIHAATARKLGNETLERLADELTKQLGGQSYELDATLDPKLLGGARLTTANASLDLTLAAQLQNVRISHG